MDQREYPFPFHGRRPADWFEGEWQIDCFLERAELDVERAAAALAPLFGRGGVEQTLRAWRRPEALRLSFEIDGRNDRFLDQVERIATTLHSVAPLRMVVARTARAPGTSEWDQWSRARGEALPAPPFGEDDRASALEEALARARAERARAELAEAAASEGPRAVPTSESWTPPAAAAARGLGRCDELDSARCAVLEPDRRTIVVFDAEGGDRCRWTAPADIVSMAAHGDEVFAAVGAVNLGYGNPENHGGRVFALSATTGTASVRYTQPASRGGKGGYGPVARVAAGPGGLAVGTLYQLIAIGPDGTEIAVKNCNASFVHAAGQSFLVESKRKQQVFRVVKGKWKKVGELPLELGFVFRRNDRWFAQGPSGTFELLGV